MLKIEIKTANAAFSGGAFGPELERILKRLGREITTLCNDEELDNAYTLRDLNGNKVGVCYVTGDYGANACD